MEKNKKIMLIGAGIGALAGAGVAYFMNKKDTKSLLIYAAIGLAVGVAGGFASANLFDKKLGTTKPADTKNAPAETKPVDTTPETPQE